VHWPPNGGPGVSTWEQFVAAREAGLAREIGVSNYSLDQIDTVAAATGVTPAVNQIKWSPLLYDAHMLAEHRNRGVAVEGYSPLRAGTLRHPALIEIGGKYDKEPAQVVVRWHLQHEVVVIPKSARRERIAGNADVFDFELTPDELATIDALAR
jgi:2,5-diketo-D-gluconate reductase A